MGGDFIGMDLKFFFQRDQLAKELGLELISWDKGFAKVRLKVQQKHLNGVGLTHGGAIFTLADFAFAVASNSYGQIALGITATISYLKGCGEGDVLIAEAKEIALSSKLATYEVKIYLEQGDIIAVFQGTVYRKKQLLTDLIDF